jgi:hypothetical protein
MWACSPFHFSNYLIECLIYFLGCLSCTTNYNFQLSRCLCSDHISFIIISYVTTQLIKSNCDIEVLVYSGSMFQDRSRLKKSKSSKRKRRYSSDSADSARKKPRKSKKLKKKSRKKPHKVIISPTSSSYSSDYSVSSCSTCEKRKASRSRSPITRSSGKSKIRKGRVGSSSKYKGGERGRSLRRSRSCSTCSTSSTHNEKSMSARRSRSPKRSKRLRKDREKAEKSQVLRQFESDSEDRDKIIPAYDDIVSPSKDEEKQVQRETTESELVAEEPEKVVPVKTQNDGTNKMGVVDVELILRQKALENFIKFHKVKKCGISGEREKAVLHEPNEDGGSVRGAMATDKVEEPTLDEPTKVITDIDLTGKGEIVTDTLVKRPKLRSVIVVPAEREVSGDNITINADEVSNGIKEVPEHLERESDKESEPNPEVTDPSSIVATGLRRDEKQHKTISDGVEEGGAQYEKKTFSRMHDGETVQVSFYMPSLFFFLR